MRNLIWRPRALDQLDSLVGYVAERDKQAAERIEQLVVHATNMIQIVPNGGRPGRVQGTREWIIHPNYVLIYRVTARNITILRLLHARQRFPD